MALLTACQPSEENLVAQYTATLGTYCLRCHNYVDREADLMLDRVDLADIGGHPEIFEKVANPGTLLPVSRAKNRLC